MPRLSTLRPPDLGPIVGHTTACSSRIWIGARVEMANMFPIRADPRSATISGRALRRLIQKRRRDRLTFEHRTIAVIGVISENGLTLDPMPIYYFRLRREFVRTGSINLGVDTDNLAYEIPTLRLSPNSRYVVRVGCFDFHDPNYDDADPPWDQLPPPQYWKSDLLKLDQSTSQAIVQTFPLDEVNSTSRLSFLLGSCRYPSFPWAGRASDRIFDPMTTWVCDSDEPARFVLMVGDQIYADRYRIIDNADTSQEFHNRYREAFRSPNIRRLMQNAPTYMILDDHEIEDNWSRNRLHDDSRYELFTAAMEAYMSYQWSHGPRTWGKRLYYRFNCCGYPFFVLDTRTQRIYGDEEDLSGNHLLGRPSLAANGGQLEHLLAWLTRQQRSRGNVPKFIVTSGPFVPNSMNARQQRYGPDVLGKSDRWPAFPATRDALLARIVEEEIQNVVFLSGDIHCFNVAKLCFEGTDEAAQLKAFSVTSSPLYWPFPFADGEPSDFVCNSAAQQDTYDFAISNGTPISLNYRAGHFFQEDNFGHITVDPDAHTLCVRARDKRGEVKQEAMLSLSEW